MSTTEKKTMKAFVVRDFTDAGTETSFTASDGKPETLVEIDEGAFGNYQAAGLVREPDDAKPAKSGGKVDA